MGIMEKKIHQFLFQIRQTKMAEIDFDLVEDLEAEIETVMGGCDTSTRLLTLYFLVCGLLEEK